MVLLVADLQELKANPERPAIGTIVEAAAGQEPRRRRDRARPDRHAQGRRHHRRRRDVRPRPRARERPRQARQAGRSGQRRRRPRPVRGPGGRRHPARRRRREGRPRRSSSSARPTLAAKGGDGSGRATLEDLYRQIQAGQAKELRIILKADVSGSLGAITHALEQLDQDEVRINVLHEGAGDITDNDIMLAAASNAIVVGFNTDDHRHRPPGRRGRGRRRPALRHHLQADRRHRGGPQGPARAGGRRGRRGPRGGPPGHPVGKNTVIAGSYVTDGRIVRGGARVWRGGKVIATDRIESLRRFRDDVREVQTNYECGIGLANFHDLEEGDVIECFTTQTRQSRVAAPS